MQSEWRRFEVERTEWDIERIKLKTQLSVSERRVHHLTGLYNRSQRQIALLENILKGENHGVVEETPETKAAAENSVPELIAVTSKTKEKSKALLTRCLAEIDSLLGESKHLATSSSTSSSFSGTTDKGDTSSGSSKKTELPQPKHGKVALLKRPPKHPNGIIESNISPAQQTEMDTAVALGITEWQKLMQASQIKSEVTASTLASGAEAPEETKRPDSAPPPLPLASSPPLQLQRAKTEKASPSPRLKDIDDHDPKWLLPPGKRPIRQLSSVRRRRMSQPPLTTPGVNTTNNKAKHKEHQSAAREPDGLELISRSNSQLPPPPARSGSADMLSPSTSNLIDSMDEGIARLTVDEVDMKDSQEEAGMGIGSIRKSRHSNHNGNGIIWQWEQTKTLAGHLDTVRSVCMRQQVFPEDHEGYSGGPQLISGSDDGSVALWDIDRSEQRKTRRRNQGFLGPTIVFRGHTAAVTSVVMEEDHPFAYSGSLDSTIKVWRLPNGSESAEESGSDAHFPVQDLVSYHSDAVWDFALCTEASLLASISADSTCKIWSIDTDDEEFTSVLSLRMTLQNMLMPTSACFATPDGEQLAVSYINGAIDVKNLATGVDEQTIRISGSGNGRRITKMVGQPDDNRNLVAAGCVDGRVHLFDRRTGAPAIKGGIGAFNEADEEAAVTGLDFGMSMAIVAGGSNGAVRWFDARKIRPSSDGASDSYYEEPRAHSTKGDEGVCSLAVLPTTTGETSLVASAGADGLVRLYKHR